MSSAKCLPFCIGLGMSRPRSTLENNTNEASPICLKSTWNKTSPNIVCQWLRLQSQNNTIYNMTGWHSYSVKNPKLIWRKWHGRTEFNTINRHYNIQFKHDCRWRGDARGLDVNNFDIDQCYGWYAFECRQWLSVTLSTWKPGINFMLSHKLLRRYGKGTISCLFPFCACASKESVMPWYPFYKWFELPIVILR